MGWSDIAGTVGRVLGDVATFGTNELVGNPIGNIAESIFGSKSPTVPQLGQQSPVDVLTSTGGAPLLSQIALGGDVNDSLASYLKVDKTQLMAALGGQNNTLNLDPNTLSALQGIRKQLATVQNDVNVKNSTIQKLVQDFPNYMAQQIPKYKGIADQATLDAANLALQKVGAKYAAGGELSSGAMAAASARVGAEYGRQNLEYGTQMAMQDWGAQYSEANALRNFQMKMLGQGVEQGFNATQNALQRNLEAQGSNANYANQYRVQQQGQTNAMMGAVGTLGGMYLGSKMFGPMAAMGSGGNVAGGGGDTGLGIGGMNPNMSPRLNMPGYAAGANPYGNQNF